MVSVLSLPFELTSQLFLHCLPEDGRVRPDPKTTPLLVAQICRQWREVALLTPELWATIAFEQSHDAPAPYLLVQLWFSRSAKCPLSITNPPDDLIPLVLSHSARLGRLELTIFDAFISQFNNFHGSFPCLHTLSMDGCQLWRLGEDFPMSKALLRKTPALRVLSFPSPLDDYFCDPSVPVCPSVSVLEFTPDWRHPLVLQIIYSFSIFPGLRHLTLHDDAGNIPLAADLNNRAIDNCPPLHSLVLDCLTELIGKLTIPTLEDLTLLGTESTVADELESFVIRSRCPLTRLNIVHYGRDKPNLRRVYELATHVVQFSIANLVEETIDLLMSTNALPALQHLRLETGKPFRWDAFIRLLRARSKLRSAEYSRFYAPTLEPCLPPTAEHLAALDTIAEGGMPITLKWGLQEWCWGTHWHQPKVDLWLRDRVPLFCGFTSV